MLCLCPATTNLFIHVHLCNAPPADSMVSYTTGYSCACLTAGSCRVDSRHKSQDLKINRYTIPFKELHAVLMSINLSDPDWLVPTAVLLVQRSMEDMEHPQHLKSACLRCKMSSSPSAPCAKARPSAMLNQNPHHLCMT